MGFADYIASMAVVVAGMIYPGYQSFKAIKAGDVTKQQAWLQYWLVLSVVAGLNLFLEPLLYSRVPVWPLLKVGVVGFLVYPKTKGYEKIYSTVLQPQLEKHEAVIDDTMDKGMKALQDGVAQVGPLAQKHLDSGKNYVNGMMNKKSS